MCGLLPISHKFLTMDNGSSGKKILGNPWEELEKSSIQSDTIVQLAIEKRRQLITSMPITKARSCLPRVKKHVIRDRDYVTYNYRPKDTGDEYDVLGKLLHRSQDRIEKRRQLEEAAHQRELQREKKKIEEEHLACELQRKKQEERLKLIKKAYERKKYLDEQKRTREKEELANTKLAVELHKKILLRRCFRRLHRHVVHVQQQSQKADEHYTSNLLFSTFHKLKLNATLMRVCRQKKIQSFYNGVVLRRCITKWKTVSVVRRLESGFLHIWRSVIVH